jgi:hypothetical protein
MATKYTKWPQNIPNGRKMDQMGIYVPTSSIAKTSKIYPNWYFWFENKPSGNPGSKREGGNVVVNIDLCNMQQCLCDLHIHT